MRGEDVKIQWMYLGLFALLFWRPCAAGDDSPFLPSLYTVRIVTPNGSWGHGVRLDDHRILTAAHVVDEEADGASFKAFDLHGREIGIATIAKIGSRRRPDLALLTYGFDPTQMPWLRLRDHIRICEQDAAPGEKLGVAFGNVFHSTHASFDFVTMSQQQATSTATEAFFSRGVSGAGVYSTERSCLTGIVSQRETWEINSAGCLADAIGTKPRLEGCGVLIGTKYVVAAEIRAFLSRQ